MLVIDADLKYTPDKFNNKLIGVNEANRRQARTILRRADTRDPVHGSTHCWYFCTDSVAIMGLKWRDDIRDYTRRMGLSPNYLDQVYDNDLTREAIFLFVTAGAIFIFAVVLLLVSCCKITPRGRHILATFIMMLEFTIGVVLLLRNRNNSDLDDFSTLRAGGVSFRGT